MKTLAIILSSILLVTLFAVAVNAVIDPGNSPADLDGDSIDDEIDACLNTAPGAIVDSTGCSIDQLCSPTSNYRNHGAYVSCVAHEAEEFALAGLITEEQKGIIVSNAAQTSIGK
jgi:hypothetical protein